jgi:CheY-like chemotaxis protein
MADEEHLKILKQGVEVWNRWREENIDLTPDLSYADLNRANLSKANLSRADLSEASLSGANLEGASLREANLNRAKLNGADLNRANLSKANLSQADLSAARLIEADLSAAHLNRADLSAAHLSRADLSGADLSYADLFRADLSQADLSRADLRRANLQKAIAGTTMFADLDLSEVRGLETVQHRFPSTIGIDTIYKSKGKIRESFLRGCGLPDTFIAYIASLTHAAIPYFSCFISHSHQDAAFAQRLHDDLQGKGVRCWFALEDVRGGEKLYPQIDQAIPMHDKLLLVLSEHSMHSEWVTTEIRRTRQGEIRDGRRKLFPIRLVDWETIEGWVCFDADTGKDLAVEVRKYFMPDFSNWETHSAYQPAFDQLLHDLKAEEETHPVGSTRILLVEDSKDICEILKIVLQEEGFDVDTASDGQDALEQLEWYHFDFLITDVIMPRIDGFELVTRMLQGDVPRLPFIILASVSDHFRRAVASFGEDQVVWRDEQVSQLAARVRRILEKARQNDN